MYEVRKTAEFDEWLKALTDQRAVAKVVSRIERLGQGNPGDVKAVGEGVSEMRIHQARQGYRSGDMKGKKMVKTSKFDAADYLKTPAAIAAYLTEALETDDPAYICIALDTVARAKGIGDIAKATGLSRESLYKTFKETAKPEFETVRKVIGALGVKLVAEPIEKQKVA